MAEFGVQATQLAAPQGAGSAPLAPVQEQSVNTSGIPVIASVGESIAKGVAALMAPKESAVATGWHSQQEALDRSLEKEDITASEYKVRKDALWSQSVQVSLSTGGDKSLKVLEAAREARARMGTFGEQEVQQKTQLEIDSDKLKQASKLGIVTYAGMDKAARQAVIEQVDVLNRINADQELASKSLDYRVKVDSFNQAQDERRARVQVSSLMSTEITKRMAFSDNLAQLVKQNKMTKDEAANALTESHIKTTQALIEADGGRGEAFKPFKDNFDQMHKWQLSMFDEKADVEKIKLQIEGVQSRMKLMLLNDNKELQGYVAASSLFGHSPAMMADMIKATANVRDRIATITSMDRSTSIVVGTNPKDEQAIYKNLLTGMGDVVKDPSNKDAVKDASRGVNNVLSQMKDIKTKASSASLGSVMNFIADPKFKDFLAIGNVDAQALQGAKEAYQLSYQSAITDNLSKTLEGVYKQKPETDVMGAPRSVSAIERGNLQVNFDGVNVSFTVKQMPSDPVQRRNIANAIDSLNSSRAAISQLVRAGAHLENSNDYTKFWETNKHVILPNVFSGYEGLEIGDVKDGFRYIGYQAGVEGSGPPSNTKSWEKVGK